MPRVPTSPARPGKATRLGGCDPKAGGPTADPPRRPSPDTRRAGRGAVRPFERIPVKPLPEGTARNYLGANAVATIAALIGVTESSERDRLARELETAAHWYALWSHGPREADTAPVTAGKEASRFEDLGDRLQHVLRSVKRLPRLEYDRLAFAALDVARVPDGLEMREGSTRRGGGHVDVFIDTRPLAEALAGAQSLHRILSEAAGVARGQSRKGNRRDVVRDTFLAWLRRIHRDYATPSRRGRTLQPFVMLVLRAVGVVVDPEALKTALRRQRGKGSELEPSGGLI